MCRIEPEEYVTAGIGPSSKLDEKRRKQVVKLLFFDVPEIKIEIGHRGPPGITQGYDIFYDRGAELKTSVCKGRKELKEEKPDDTFA